MVAPLVQPREATKKAPMMNNPMSTHKKHQSTISICITVVLLGHQTTLYVAPQFSWVPRRTNGRSFQKDQQSCTKKQKPTKCHHGPGLCPRGQAPLDARPSVVAPSSIAKNGKWKSESGQICAMAL